MPPLFFFSFLPPFLPSFLPLFLSIFLRYVLSVPSIFLSLFLHSRNLPPSTPFIYPFVHPFIHQSLQPLPLSLYPPPFSSLAGVEWARRECAGCCTWLACLLAHGMLKAAGGGGEGCVRSVAAARVLRGPSVASQLCVLGGDE